MSFTRRDVLAVTATGTMFSMPVIRAQDPSINTEDHALKVIHWVEQEDGEMILITPGGRCLISVLQDQDKEDDHKINTWQILDQSQVDAGGNWVKLGRYQTRERAMLVAEKMFE